ncbi:MarR family transcriptional regulator [Deinococcus aestuarii]
MKRVGLAQSFVSRLVAELWDEGLLTTRPDPADRRRVG